MSKSTQNYVGPSPAAHRLRTIRELLGLSQAKAAHRVGVKQQDWGRYETGTRMPDTFIGSVITHFPVDAVWFLIGELPDRLNAMCETVVRDHSDTSIEEVADRLSLTAEFLRAVITGEVGPSEGLVSDFYRAYGASPPSLYANLGSKYIRKAKPYDELEHMLDEDPDALPGLVDL